MRIKIYFLKVKKLKANERRLLGAAYFPRVCETKDVWLFPVDQMGTVHKRAGVVLDPVQESHLEPQKDHDKEARGLLSSWGMRELSWALLQNLDAHVRETVPFFLLKNQKSTWGGRTEVLGWKGTGSSQCCVVFTHGVFLCCHKMANTHYCLSNWAILWTSVNSHL